MVQVDSFFDAVTPNFLVVLRGLLLILLIGLSVYYLINIGNQYIDKSKRIRLDLRRVGLFLSAILLFIIIRYVFQRFPVLPTTLAAIVISMILAYIINPLVSYLETKKISRRLGVLIVYIGFILIFVVLFLVVLPKTVEELRNLFTSLPNLVNDLNLRILDSADHIEKVTNIDMSRILNNVQDGIEQYLNSLQTSLLDRLRSMASGMYAAFGRIVSFILVLILTYYFTVDKNRIKVKMYKMIPSSYRSDILYLASEINTAMLEFVKGKLLLAVIVGVTTTIMLLILGVNFAVAIGLITIVADIIPYIGPFLAFVPAFFFSVMDSWTKAIWVSIFFVFLQWAENNLFAPKILGKRTGLHPAVVLLCIVIGGGTFGVIGMILSVPVFSILTILKNFTVMKWRDHRQRKNEVKKVQ
ncbi:putative sporulation integral membrane protein YtvI [Aedoeadaptatus nemausensis]|uniref:Putative sporulation integral membrane protein YtvI n=1 Tax=Aedoeadaptatus nemausensis TaxID=2582829 RepID=A0A6V6Y0I3_9FIRM|nr:AI-2E family transporter [Peptoniphilus nemausensis]CAC9924638.1 putative sporulation integral membrane protein YtvI [Peptoniphilus nemausensis]